MTTPLQILIDHLRKVDDSPTSKLGFDMHWNLAGSKLTDHPCGSACCIGGHAADIMGLTDIQADQALMQFLGIEHGTAYDIAYPDYHWDATLPEAIAMLERFQKTGEVQW